nr:hypothetical protein [Vibrio splendidus]MCC4881479.1 hypothetical protein [Vibrio splendidus]
MCDTLKMTKSEVKLLKNKEFTNSEQLSPLVKLVGSLFSRAHYTLSNERVAVVSDSFKKPCVLRTFFSKKILTVNNNSPLQTLIQINRFKADSIIVKRKYLQELTRHFLTGTTQHRYKNIYVLPDDTFSLDNSDLLSAAELTLSKNPESVKLISESILELTAPEASLDSRPYSASELTETKSILEHDSIEEAELIETVKSVSPEDFSNVTRIKFDRSSNEGMPVNLSLASV